MTRPRYGYALGNSNIRPPELQRPSKRGGSGTFALTNTQDPSLYPTVPPESKFDSGVPKIGGSEGGFIGLVVGLAALILICACAVFYLLHSRPHGGRSGNKNYPPSFTPAPSSFFGSRRKRNAGWVQQQNDEFDYDSAEDEDLTSKNKTQRSSRYGEGGTGYTGQPMQDTRLNMSSSVVPAAAGTVDAYTDPFDPAKLPERVHKQQAPLPTTSRDPARESYNSSASTYKQSPTTPTFEGGTKFREGL